MRLAATVMLLLVASAGLAGCSKPLDPPQTVADDSGKNVDFQDEGDVEVEVEKKEDAAANETAGDLLLTVLEPGGRGLEGVMVSVITTDLDDQTDEDGAILFEDVEAGRYTLRLQAKQGWYKVVEANVTVTGGAVTKATVKLPLRDGFLTPPHTHGDAWTQGDRVTLFAVTHDDFQCAGLQSYCYDTGGNNRYEEFPFPEVVPPGTGALEITAEWSSPSSSPFYLDVRGPGTHHLDLEFTDPGNTVTVEITAQEPDPPHAVLSTWTYQWSPDLTGLQFGTWQPPFVITVAALRGAYELPLDPPHPDHWEGRERIRLASVTDTADAVEMYLGATAVNSAPDRTFDEGRIVFPGTDRIEFRAWVNHTLPHDPTMDLWYKPHTDAEWTIVSADTQDGVLYSWDVPVVPDWYDPLYGTHSDWRFRIQPHSQVPVEGSNSRGIAYDGGYTLHATATAVKQGA